MKFNLYPIILLILQPVLSQDISHDLVNYLNVERQKLNLTKVAYSQNLSKVASLHINNLLEAKKGYPYLHDWFGSRTCTLHWDNHCMWDKPRQLTPYKYYGYEISVEGPTTVKGIIDGLANSKLHNHVMYSKEMWSKRPWQAVGAAYKNRLACFWFGHELDDGKDHDQPLARAVVSEQVKRLNELVMARRKREKELKEKNAH